MARRSRNVLSRVRGASRLIIDAATGTTDVVEQMHRTIQSVASPVGTFEPRRTRGITGLVYRAVRGSMRLVGHGIDATVASLEPFVPEGDAAAGEDALQAAINGVYGDYLAQTGNELAIEMTLRGPALGELEVGPGGSRVLVLVHGLCMSDGQWRREGHDHGAALAERLGVTPLYLRYNSGLAVADNGRAFAVTLEETLGAWPVEVSQLAILGFSMGGLVARSACFYGRELGMAWPDRVTELVTLGTPHAGAPLAQHGHWVDQVIAFSPYSAPIGRLAKRRSAGLHDLRLGAVTEDPGAAVALPEGARCFAIAGTRSEAGNDPASLDSDGLVPVDSALGRSPRQGRMLDFPQTHRKICYEAGHLDLLNDTEAFEQMSDWLAES